jgi:hypothetical protein
VEAIEKTPNPGLAFGTHPARTKGLEQKTFGTRNGKPPKLQLASCNGNETGKRNSESGNDEEDALACSHPAIFQ